MGTRVTLASLQLPLGDESGQYVLDRLVESNTPGGDLAQRQHRGAVVAHNSGHGTMQQLLCTGGGQQHERKVVSFSSETVFYG
jgi:hypothetical protein